MQTYLYLLLQEKECSKPMQVGSFAHSHVPSIAKPASRKTKKTRMPKLMTNIALYSVDRRGANSAITLESLRPEVPDPVAKNAIRLAVHAASQKTTSHR